MAYFVPMLINYSLTYLVFKAQLKHNWMIHKSFYCRA